MARTNERCKLKKAFLIKLVVQTERLRDFDIPEAVQRGVKDGRKGDDQYAERHWFHGQDRCSARSQIVRGYVSALLCEDGMTEGGIPIQLPGSGLFLV